MVPELKEVLLDLPAPVLNALGAEGVETASDLVGLYPHVDAFLDHISSTMRARVDADAALEMAGVWTRVARMARGHETCLTPAEPAARPARMKHLVAGGSGQSQPATIVEGQDAKIVKDEAVKQNKLDLLFHILLEYVVDLAELGLASKSRTFETRWPDKGSVTLCCTAPAVCRRSELLLVSSFRQWARHCQREGWNLQRQGSPWPIQASHWRL